MGIFKILCQTLIYIFFCYLPPLSSSRQIDAQSFYDCLLTSIYTPGNVVRGNRTVMQRKALRQQPAMNYGLDNNVYNKVSDPVLLFSDSFTAGY